MDDFPTAIFPIMRATLFSIIPEIYHVTKLFFRWLYNYAWNFNASGSDGAFINYLILAARRFDIVGLQMDIARVNANDWESVGDDPVNPIWTKYIRVKPGYHQ